MALARHVELSVKMSVAVTMSMNQSSNLDKSCPSNLGISWGMFVFRGLILSALHAGCLCMPAWFCALVPHWTGELVGASC